MEFQLAVTLISSLKGFLTLSFSFKSSHLKCNTGVFSRSSNIAAVSTVKRTTVRGFLMVARRLNTALIFLSCLPCSSLTRQGKTAVTTSSTRSTPTRTGESAQVMRAINSRHVTGWRAALMNEGLHGALKAATWTRRSQLERRLMRAEQQRSVSSLHQELLVLN